LPEYLKVRGIEFRPCPKIDNGHCLNLRVVSQKKVYELRAIESKEFLKKKLDTA
jgi:hypothetical protein